MSVKDVLTGLDKQYCKMSSLQKQLACSCALQELWSEVFKHGSCRSVVISKYRTSIFKLTDGRGETKEFDFDTIPKVLKNKHFEQIARKIR